ncbi:MAG: hypothetical protein A3K22_03545 [Deltaproteobacteria bacterium RBG_16_42_7]|nr:MAG: hypothetical protein A3K22_03545 [Deltaproteobacteria bacterium RBG_16_42_7]
MKVIKQEEKKALQVWDTDLEGLCKQAGIAAGSMGIFEKALKDFFDILIGDDPFFEGEAIALLKLLEVVSDAVDEAESLSRNMLLQPCRKCQTLIRWNSSEEVSASGVCRKCAAI